MTYQEFRQSVEAFGLGERASFEQIKLRHRELVKTHHPDQGEHNDPEKIRRINAAYEVLERYCKSYKYSFSEEEFVEQVPGERLRRQFGWDPVWGCGEQEKT